MMNEIYRDTPVFMGGVLIGTIAFGLYAEYGPGMGKVLFRPNDNNEIIFSLGGLIPLMIAPLNNKFMWLPKNLDINYPFIALTSGLISCVLFKKI